MSNSGKWKEPRKRSAFGALEHGISVDSRDLPLIGGGDFLQNIRMGKVRIIHDVRLTDHAEIFYGECDDLALPEFVHAGTAGQNGNPQIFADQVLDGGDIVDLKGDIEIMYGFAPVFQSGFKQGTGGR